MIKYYISYFYMIRFLKPNQIPISTALWDPPWFHDFQGSTHVFFNNRKIINGLRSPLLNPTTAECSECVKKEKECLFKKHYLEHLRSINFQQFRAELEEGIMDIASRHHIENPEIVLIVYETPDNPCSERAGLQQWFRENGVALPEFTHVERKETNAMLDKLL